MSSSSQAIKALPEFVYKQAEQALHHFLTNRECSVHLEGDLHRSAIVIYEVTPHPLTHEQVRLPIALLNWRDNRWRLYFRGTRGRWVSYPDAPTLQRPEPLLARVAQDELGIFWRQ